MNADADKLAKPDSGSDDDEQQVWTGGYSGKAMIGTWIGALVVSIILLVITIQFLGDASWKWPAFGILMLVIWGGLGSQLLYRKMSMRYELTTQRFIHMEGILSRSVNRIELIDIDDVTYNQGLIERIVTVGTIKIESSDRSHPEFWMRGIENVKEVADQIDDLRRKERRRRGLHIEAI